MDFELLKSELEVIGSDGIKKVADGGLCQSHRDAMPADNRRRHDTIGARSEQFAFGLFFGGASDDVKVWIQVARSQHYIKIIGIVGQARSETASVFDTGLAQALLECRVARNHRNAEIEECFHLGRVEFDDQEGFIGGRKAAQQMRSDAACATDDKMISHVTYFSRMAIR